LNTATLSATSNTNGPCQSGGGPASKQHTVPPRPKPGRKPATEEPESRRKAQNRASQRNFRERKQKNVQNLLETVAMMKQEQNDKDSANARTLQAMEERMQYLARSLHESQEANRLLEQRLKIYEQGGIPDTQGLSMSAQNGPPEQNHDFAMLRNARHDQPLQNMQSGCNRCTPEHCACLADLTHDLQFSGEAMAGVVRDGHEDLDDEKHPHVEYEVDFTEKFKTKHHPVAFAPSMEESKITDCGFCEGQKEICICDPPTRVDSADESTSLTRMTSGSSSEDVKPKMAMTGPGSCADCQSNPQQRAWCQRVAQLRSEGTPSSSRRNSSKSSSLDIMEPKASTSIDMNAGFSSPVGTGRTVGCSEAFKLLDGRVSTDPNDMDWRQLKPVPQTFARQEARRDTFTMEPGMYSAMELDASSILTTLQHAQRPLRPRPSDGPHAPLIEEAEERRRASFSPMTKVEDHAMLDAVSHYNIG
jgi:ribosomal protein S15P/S13E